mgnify:CR=1 FL=1
MLSKKLVTSTKVKQYNYTGKIVSEGKDGSKVVMEYLDGVLQNQLKQKVLKLSLKRLTNILMIRLE